jgi:diguanylate cyclase (GGDEF)-like protein/PAS domain S-box-containing protein
MTDDPFHAALPADAEIGRLLGDVFDPERTERVADARLTQTLGALLAAYPAATISAFLPTGVPVAVPGSIDAGDRPMLVHSGIDGLPGTDRDRIIAAFYRALSLGAASCVVSPVGVGGVTAYVVDLTAAHGVAVVVLVAGREMPARGAADRVVGIGRPPRLATLRKDADALIIGVDPALTEILGWEAGELLGRRAADFVHPDDRSLVIESWVRMRAGAPAPRLRQRMRHRDGTWVWFEVVNHDRLDDDAHPCVLGEMVDISEEMAAHEALREREQLLMRLAETIPVGLAQVDGAGVIQYANERLGEILGASAGPALADALQALVPHDRRSVATGIAQLLAEGSAADFEVALRLGPDAALRFATINLRPLTREDGSSNGGIVCVADSTETVRMRDALRVRATFDELTGGHNRGSILQALHAHISTHQRRSNRAVLFVDLDGFKAVNDRHGHAAGDELLRVVARELREAARSDDLVGRLGGDEFLVVCPEIGSAENGLALARRIADRLGGPLTLAAGEVTVQVSIGVAWSAGDAQDADALVDRADRAMYESKRERQGVPKLAPRPRTAT